MLLVLLLLAPGFVLLLLLPLWACMQSFRWSDDHPIDASSLPDAADVRSALESGGGVSSASLEEMLVRLAAQLQLDDRDLQAYATAEGAGAHPRSALVRALVLELLDIAPRRVCTGWARMLREWPAPAVVAVRLQALRHVRVAVCANKP